MATSNENKEQTLQLEYPCRWCYKLIGEDTQSIQEAVKEVIDEREHSLAASKTSKKGKYVSMNLDMLVHNDDDRKLIYEALKKHDKLKMVL